MCQLFTNSPIGNTSETAQAYSATVAPLGLPQTPLVYDSSDMARKLTHEDASVVMENAGYSPLEPYTNSGHKWKCLCKSCGREVTPTYDEARIGSKCKYCARKAVTPEDAVKLMKNSGFEPLEPYPGAMKPWKAVHTCGSVLTPRYAHIQQGRRGCKKCSGEIASKALSLDNAQASSFMFTAGYQPLEQYPGSNNKPWRCIHIACGREVKPRYAGIQQGQGGCKPCHQDKLAKRYRTPEQLAVQTMIDHGFTPLVPYPGSSKGWKSSHTCGKIVSPSLSGVKNSDDSGCVYCSGHKVDENEAVLKMLENGLKPLAPFPGSNKAWKSIHSCGREVSPRYNSVINTGAGPCKYCAVKGIDYKAPGIIYILRHEEFFSIKVGISTISAKANRIASHEKFGWKLVNSWPTATGETAELIESIVLRWWRDTLGAPASLMREQMKSGWTETASLLYVSTEATANYIDRLVSELQVG